MALITFMSEGLTDICAAKNTEETRRLSFMATLYTIHILKAVIKII